MVKYLFPIVFILLLQPLFAVTQKLPIVQNVGLIPIRWIGQDHAFYGLSEKQLLLESVYSISARDSRRFRMLNDELVKQLWSSAEGRQELNEQYELHAFTSLSVLIADEVVTFELQLLSPSLQPYLFESLTVSRVWFANAQEKDLKEKLNELIFRTYNRVPVDVSVTSVQEPYITLSGGDDQNIRIGDRVQLIRVFVATQHPANGNWLSFKTEKLGFAKIIEVKKYTSIAQLLELTYENSVQVADGAKIQNINSRANFKRLAQNETIDDDSSESVIVEPLYSDGKPSKKEPKKEQVDDDDHKDQQKIDKQEQSTSADEPKDQAKLEQPIEQNQDEPQSAQGNEQPFAWLTKYFEYGRVEFGPKLWSASGAASATASFPLWLVNHAVGYGGKKVADKMYTEYGLLLEYGPTGKGSFMGFGILGSFFYKDVMQDKDSPVSHWRAGVKGGFTSIAVSSETYGGVDLVTLEFFGGVLGTNPVSEDSNVEWYGDFGVAPFAFGQAGAGGSKKSVSSIFGWSIEGGGYLLGKPGEVEWGGILHYSNYSLSLNSGSLSVGDLSILAAARTKF